MPTIESSGTKTADGTEQTLATVSTNRSLQLYVDLNALASGDTVVLRSKRRILSGGVTRTFEEVTYTDAQTELIAALNPLSSPHEAIFTLEQTAGTNRAFPFSVESL